MELSFNTRRMQCTYGVNGIIMKYTSVRVRVVAVVHY